VSRQTLAMVVGDIVGTTQMLATDGELAVFATIQEFMRDVERLVAAYHGRCIKTLGDSFLAVFENVADALPFAAALNCSQSQQKIPGHGALRLCFSLHLGTVVIGQTTYGEEIFGSDVNIAARLLDVADAGQIVISRAACQALPQQQAAVLGPRERVRLKGLAEATEFSRVDLAKT